MKFKLFVPLYGSYGPDGEDMMAQPGSIVEIPDYDKTRLKKFLLHEAAGRCQQLRPPVDRKAFTVYQNKAITPPENKLQFPKPAAK